MAENFKVGDVVMLRSGGPNMVVSEVYGTTTVVQAFWFDGGEVCRSEFDIRTLRRWEIGDNGSREA